MLEEITVSKDENIVEVVNNLLEEIQNNLFNKASNRVKQLSYTATNLSEVEDIMNKQPGFIKADWCGREECELKMKEIKGTKSRCIVDEEMVTGKCVCCGEEAKNTVIWGIQY